MLLSLGCGRLMSNLSEKYFPYADETFKDVSLTQFECSSDIR